ncbi:MAG: zinc-dependent metalloprotease [Vicinamibacterales bacterium]|nr:zinc-dependent metalloprotease [Vicinamibacterales bacterium]
MMTRRNSTLTTALVAALLLAMAPVASADQAAQSRPGALPTIEEKTAGFAKQDGFFPLYWDEATGTLWLEIPSLGTEVIYVSALAAGLGSNDIGLDRGRLGGTQIVRFDRIGTKVLMVQPNYDYRATTDNPDEVRAVRDAFASSTLWGFTAAAQTGGRTLVDLSDFLLRDSYNIVSTLRPATYRVDRTRSAVFMERSKAFPRNTTMEATVTFVADAPGAGPGLPGGRIGDVAASAEAVTLRLHHQFVQLPDNGYTPRAFDPRAGYGARTYADYGAPLGESMQQRHIRRHRLKKKDPNAAVSAPVAPIIYYLDRGTPEPVRTALLEGGRWWDQAFEAAGYTGAFRVEMMPEGADMLDVRYNVIQWVHRSTRGWSYGASVSDPRTGEILKGHVTLGSLRVRQDYLIAEGLLSPYETGTEAPTAMRDMAVARLRQLSAHEIGHTIGISHNYYNSTAGRISVMDYPHPLSTLRADGTIDLSDAYTNEIGAWDKVAVNWGYREFPAGADEAQALEAILNDAWEKDLRFLSNQDIDVTPRADQWNNGVDMAAGLMDMLRVRRAALDRFGERAIKRGVPMTTIEEALVPLYLHHRYQIEATASALGGQDYHYAIRGDGRPGTRWVPATAQNGALDALMASIAPAELVLPRSVLDAISPRVPGYGMHRELFPRTTGLIFDPIAPAVVAAQHTLGALLQPQRAARMVAQRAIDPGLPGLAQVLDRVTTSVFDRATTTPYEAEVNRSVERVVAEHLMNLAANGTMPQVRALAVAELKSLRARALPADPSQSAHRALLADDIQRFLSRPGEPYRLPNVPEPPPGAPIGQMGEQWLLSCELIEP